MIHEYALDPAVVNDWPSFKYIVDQCGVHYGRLISGFPQEWQRVAINLCQIQGTKRTAIVEKLRNLGHKMMDSNRTYNDQQEWIDNAERQYGVKPFHAIISIQNPMAREYVLIAEDIEENNPLWNVSRGDVIPRTAEAIAKCASTLLSISREIIFVEPHFDFVDQDGIEIDRFFNTLINLIDLSFQNKRPKRLELHLKHKRSRQNNINAWKKLYEGKISPLLPRNFKLKVVAWKRKWDGDDMHARYILTERGGIKYDFGLDEGWKGLTTDVDLMDQGPYEKRWQDFQENTSALKPEIKFEIEGIKD